MEAVLPTRYPDSPHVIHPYLICRCPVTTGRPPKKKVVWGWDGNTERPTLKPSIGVKSHWGEDRTLVFWHGYMEAGNFRACE